MYDKFFGSFLLNKGVFTATDLKTLLMEQQNIRVKMGMLAMKQGYMNGSQVEEVCHVQKTTDKRFGEIAVEKGYLSGEQVEELLQSQSSESNLQLGQAAVDLGMLNYRQLESELAEFEKTSGLSSIQLDALQDGSPDKVVRELLDFGDTPEAAMYAEYVSLLLRNIVRSLDQQPWLALNSVDDEGEKVVVVQKLLHSKGLLTVLRMTPDSFMEAATRFAKMDLGGDMSLAEASVTEFLNQHNGIFAVNMSDQGKTVKLEPPQVLRGKEAESVTGGLDVYIDMGLGRLTVMLVPQE